MAKLLHLQSNIPTGAYELSSLVDGLGACVYLSLPPLVLSLERPSFSELCAIFATLCIFLNRTAIPRSFLLQCRPITTTGGFMDVQATYYRRRAIVARQSAAAALDPSVKAAFAEVANHWLALAGEIEGLRSVQHASRRGDGETSEMVTGEPRRRSG